MRTLGEMMHHFRLASRMAKVTGADLVGAVQAGELSQEQWADMVQICRSCEWAGGCKTWLESQQSIEMVPETCLNRQRLLSLRQKAHSRLAQRA